MKKFLLKLFLFLALLTGVLALLEIGFRQKPTIFKNKFDGLSQNASQVEVLILGPMPWMGWILASSVFVHTTWR